MIHVGPLRRWFTPWPVARLLSDSSRTELLEFAEGLGLLMLWEHRTPYPHFEISPRHRRLALERGAAELDSESALSAAIARLRAADRAARARYDDWIAAGPDRGPFPG